MSPIGDLQRALLFWHTMGYSYAYASFTGLGEIVGGLLLLWRRTVTLGGLLLIAVMSNVVVFNWFYSVGVQWPAMHFLAMAVFLAVPETRRLLDLYVLNRPVSAAPREPSVLARSSLRPWRFALKGLAIAYHSCRIILPGDRHPHFAQRKQQYRPCIPRSEALGRLHPGFAAGIADVRVVPCRAVRAGRRHPPPTHWRRQALARSPQPGSARGYTHDERFVGELPPSRRHGPAPDRVCPPSSGS